jgi:hypothetical protein
MAHGQEAANLIRKKMKEINYYMKYRKLSPDLQEKVRDHFRYAWKRSTVYDERVIMDELPTYLKTELALHLNQDLIQAVPFLKDMGNDSVSYHTTIVVAHTSSIHIIHHLMSLLIPS